MRGATDTLSVGETSTPRRLNGQRHHSLDVKAPINPVPPRTRALGPCHTPNKIARNEPSNNCAGTARWAPKSLPMDAPAREMEELELALMKRGVDQLVADEERCGRCRRTPLIGERVYIYGSSTVLCELCRMLRRDQPDGSRLIHGPAFGHTMRITDQRRAA